MEIIGMSKISIQNKVTLIEEVAQYLNISEGDKLAYLISNGDIIIKNNSSINILRGEIQ